MITTTVVSGHGATSGKADFTSSDKLHLFSTKEVWGKDGTSNIISDDTAEAETRQLDYYKNKGITTDNYIEAIKEYNDSNYYFWLRRLVPAMLMVFFMYVATLVGIVVLLVIHLGFLQLSELHIYLL